ncbi:MAG: hypothetical protein Q8L01_03420 [Candidatus Woesebacteria bacterium]|nr:hypothetical protein [Candidatus Woesebacteria bacterium]
MRRTLWATAAFALVATFLAIGGTAPRGEAASAAVVYSGSLVVDKGDRDRFWYVNPINRKRYELGFSASEAISTLQNLALGISNSNLGKIPTAAEKKTGDLALRRRISGRIMVAVEADGALWYIRPRVLKRYPLVDDESFAALRALATVLPHATVAKIPIGFEFSGAVADTTSDVTPKSTAQCGSGAACSVAEACVNNVCVPKEGCLNNNPGCYEGQTCTGNACLDNDPEPALSVAEAAQNLFGIAPGTAWPAEHWCHDRAFILRENKNFFDVGITDSLPSLRGSLPVFVRMPVKSVENLKVAADGIAILKRSLPILESYFGPYPCDELFIDAFQNEAEGSPGSIMIGGHDGLDNWWLLNHELAHSYFHKYVFQSWFVEGAAGTVPYPNIFDQIASQGTTKEAAFGFDRHPFFSLVNYLSRKTLAEGSITREQLKENGVSPATPLCQAEGNYLVGSGLGNNFMQTMIVKIGKRNYLRALAALYLKYRVTRVAVSYDDVYRAFSAFTPADSLSSVRPYLAAKLCIPGS